MQMTEDRFVLVRASSFEDAKKRLSRQWREYTAPYLNSEGQMVSWSLDRVIDVYETGETEIDSAGTEVYSKLAKRRMRPEYVWRPKLARSRRTTTQAG
jgi:phage terminase Nu1 subunit (DNA packaging protein)